VVKAIVSFAKEFPKMSKRIAIIGGVAGGASAAARARRLDENAQITIFERGPHVSFANCGLPYYIGGEIEQASSLVVQTPQMLADKFNLDVRVRSEVVAIDRDAKQLVVANLDSGEQYRHDYDVLVISTGAAPLRPPIPGIERDGHFTLRNIPDMHAIDRWIEGRTARRAVIVGGGYIGLELAEQLNRRGLQVTVAEALPQVMAPLDPEMAAMLHLELRKHGVELHLSDPVAGFESPRDGEAAGASVVVLKSGERLPADVVILGLGVKPETKLAREAQLTIGERGGIRVDEHMRTNDPAIYAIGDVVEVRNRITGDWTLVPLAGPANRQGRIVADHINGRDSAYKGTLGTAVLRLFDLTAGVTGANERTLREAGIAYEVIHLHPNHHVGYYPGAKPIAMKLLFAPGSAPDSGRILGAQAIGEAGIDKRIDVIATAILGGMTVDDLAELELSYAPPVGAAKDPVNLAGMIAQNMIAGDVRMMQWHEVDNLDPVKTLLLDVREDDERAAGHIPGSKHIPLGQLRDRLAELPKDRTILAHCQSGQRSYYACRVLSQHGYDCVNLAGSFKTWSVATEAA
jgi:NADPH-dependent 2,4-dienoyl-CoA reductase/sulfur reductase-like enzyme/rhodanese-related sulfurtransferase